MPRFKFEDFKTPTCLTNPYWISFTGESDYGRIIQRAFPHCKFSICKYNEFFRSGPMKYEWCVHTSELCSEDHQRVEKFLELLESHWYLRSAAENDLTETFAVLGVYDRWTSPLSEAKYQYSQKKTLEIAVQVTLFILGHPTYKRADLLVPVPSDRNFVQRLTSFVSSITGITGCNAVFWKRRTQYMKSISDLAEKIRNVKDAFGVSEDQIQERSIIVIDDFYDSGVTINEVSKLLRSVGATEVFGLTATVNKSSPQ